MFYSFTPDPEQWWVKPFSAGVLLLSVVLLQGWSRDPAILFSGNPAAWTLTVEMFFYLLHPWVNRFTNRLRVLGSLLLVLSMVGLCFMYWVLVTLGTVPGLDRVPLPVSRLSEFVIGMGLAQLVVSGARLRLPPTLAYALLGVFILSQVFAKWAGLEDPISVWSQALTEPIIVTLCAVIIFSVANRDMRGGFSLQNKPVMVRLGAWSFAFYLVHATVMYAIMGIVGHQGVSFSNLLWYPPVFGIALLLAWLLFRFVEAPFEKRLRGFGDRHFVGRATRIN